jgi:DNA-directed RNA polymerase II subunit RPB2
VKRLKLFRRNALINIYTSVAWYPIDNIIKISTDSGRCCRPLFIVNNNEVMFKKSMLDGGTIELVPKIAFFS